MLSKYLKSWVSIRESIQAKIFIAFSLVTLFSLITVSLVMYNNAADMIKANTAGTIIESMKNSDRNMETILREADAITLAVTYNRSSIVDLLESKSSVFSLEGFQEEKQAEDFLSSLIAYKSHITKLMAVGLEGKYFQTDGPKVDYRVFDTAWGKKILESHGSKVLLKREQNEMQNPVITLGRALMKNGNAVGLVFIDIDYSHIKKMFGEGTLSGSHILIADSEENLIYSTYPEEGMEPGFYREILQSHPDFKENQGQTELKTREGKYLTVYYKSDYSGWTTIGIIPEKLLLLHSIILRDRMVWVSLVTCLLVVFMTFAVTAGITLNIKKLRSAMKAVNEENMQVDLKISARDEIGQLSKTFVSMMNRIQKLVEDIRDKEQRKRLAELETLQAQISPHFLYNTLNTVKYMARLQCASNIEEVTASLVELLRTTLKNVGDTITIREELEYLKSYVTIQKYRFSNRFAVEYEVEAGVEDLKTIKMILQPVVENAIIHGIEPAKRAGMISVKIYREDGMIKIAVTDNGVGMTAEQINKVLMAASNQEKSRFSGIGMGNVQERLRLYFGDRYGLKIFSQPGMFTTVEITIPVIGDKEDGRDQSLAGG